MSAEDSTNVDDEFKDDSSTANTEVGSSCGEHTHRSRRSVQAWVPTSASDQHSACLKAPEDAHVSDYGMHFVPSIVTVSQQQPLQARPSDNESTLSLPSSGLSVEDVRPPSPVLEAAKHHPPGNYRCIATNFTPVSASSDAVDKEKVAKEAQFELKPLEKYGHTIASAEQLNALKAAHPLPALTGKKWYRDFRYDIASVYRRLWALVILTNVVVIAVMISRVRHGHSRFTYGNAATATGANLLVTALMRHEHSINLLFRLACLLPLSTPLYIRRHAAKVYSYGGVHSGSGISAFLWYIFYAILAVQQFNGSHGKMIALSATIAATLILFTMIVSLSHPYIRMRWHNQWEVTHRFSGWAAIALVWAQVIIIVIAGADGTQRSTSSVLIHTPTFWFLILITLMLIYPWIRLRRRKYVPEKLSSHAIRLHFPDKKLPTCVGTRLAHNPLLENHGFATIPNSDGQKGYSVVVSNAGDWTKNIINNAPSHIWTRGAPTRGVLRIATLFKTIVVVATGSGIGPCLSFLQVYPDWPMRIIWSARFPEMTYGKGIMEAVLRADEKAVIVDTKKTGHPDLPALAWALYKQIGAEAVAIISNPMVTKKVVFELECRKVPAYGPVFDS